MNGLDLSNAERRLNAVKAARDSHSQECLDWDYEGGCLECDDHDVAVSRARRRYLRVKEALGL